MFRKSDSTSEQSLFSNIRNFLTGNALKIYEKEEGWHNQFRKQVVERIDETIFRPLFSSGQGAPNASIRVLIGMMLLKEAHNWSDSQLFDHCKFNLLVRSALGLLNLDDAVPVPSTYYLLRQRIVSYETETQENLLETVFSQVTGAQALDFEISGKQIRMDSKLMGSNIAWYSRYELIHETLCQAYHSLKDAVCFSFTESDLQLLGSVCGESGNKVCYRSNKSEIESRLAELGVLIYKIICQSGDYQTDALCTLRRVFDEQYLIDLDVVTARPKTEISAQSVQSPHDPDCHYRQKGDKEVKGYSVNVCETCVPDNAVNLITNVSVEAASAADCDFLQPAVEATATIVTGNIETINADGAYHSVENQEFCNENKIDLIIGAIQGKASQYDLSLDENGDLTVTDLHTNATIIPRKLKPDKKTGKSKWAIDTGKKNKYRYFTQKEIDTCSLRKKISARTKEELNVRNNVEASIFQLGYHYSNSKSRYRGLIKHKIWANLRCLWINFVRILKCTASGGFSCIKKANKSRFFRNFYVKNYEILFNFVYFLNYFQFWIKTEKKLSFVDNYCIDFSENKIFEK